MDQPSDCEADRPTRRAVTVVTPTFEAMNLGIPGEVPDDCLVILAFCIRPANESLCF